LVTAGLVSISLAEKRFLRRDANAQSVQESGDYASSLASRNIINYLDES
jgi:hypothetical protein